MKLKRELCVQSFSTRRRLPELSILLVPASMSQRRHSRSLNCPAAFPGFFQQLCWTIACAKKRRLTTVGRSMAAQDPVLSRLDSVVDDFCRRTRFFTEPMTRGRAKMFVMQHRQNTRHRNSVLKLKVATNCPDWETRLKIIGACTQEVIADHEHGHGKAHGQI